MYRAPEPVKPAQPVRTCTAVHCAHVRGLGGHCLLRTCPNDVKACPRHRNR